MANRSLKLDNDTWDLTLDGAGNIATVQDDEEIAQSVANNIRLFRDDAYFAQTEGIPHFVVSLGRYPSPTVMRTRMREEAMKVNGVRDIQVVFTKYESRILEGVIVIQTENNTTIEVTI